MSDFEPSWISARRPLGRLREAAADFVALLLELWGATNSIPLLPRDDPPRDTFGDMLRRARLRRRARDP